MVIVLMISSGVALASRGELHFNLYGFLVQAAAVLVCPRFLSRCQVPGPISPTFTVRSLSPSDDSGAPARVEDGPSCVPSLLRTRLRGDQSRGVTIHRGSGAVLQPSPSWPRYPGVERPYCIPAKCCRCVPSGCRQRARADARRCVQGQHGSHVPGTFFFLFLMGPNNRTSCLSQALCCGSELPLRHCRCSVGALALIISVAHLSFVCQNRVLWCFVWSCSVQSDRWKMMECESVVPFISSSYEMVLLIPPRFTYSTCRPLDFRSLPT